MKKRIIRTSKQKILKCSCGCEDFSINLNREESVGVVNCQKCGKDYFLLDSAEYWYDLSQERYPPLIKCQKCKHPSFEITLTYEFTQDSESVRSVLITNECSKCNTLRNLDVWKINYSPTDLLIKKPLSFVKNPRIKPNLSTITCYWKIDDLTNFLQFLFSKNALIYCEYYHNKELIVKKITQEEALKRAKNSDYSTLNIANKKINISKNQKINWKKEEIVRLSLPLNMDVGETIGERIGKLFYIEYSLNYISNFTKGKIKEKSETFKLFTDEIKDWLKSNYESLRGKMTFDNPQEHKRLFENRLARYKH